MKRTPSRCLHCEAKFRTERGGDGVRYQARGLCHPCWTNHGGEYPRLFTARTGSRMAVDLIEDVDFLADTMGAAPKSTPLRYAAPIRRRIAVRLDMRLASLDRALYREYLRNAECVVPVCDLEMSGPERTPAA